MTQDQRNRFGRLASSMIVIAALLFLGAVVLTQGSAAYTTTAGVLLVAGAGLATMVAVATSDRQGIPSWAKYTAWVAGVLGGIILFVSVNPLAAGMVGATIGLLPMWPRVEGWIQGEHV